MKYTHATLLLEETGAEINETNLTAVLEAADAEFTTSRVKALVAALEGVDVGAHAAVPEAEPNHDAAEANGAGDDRPDAGVDSNGHTAPTEASTTDEASTTGEAFGFDLQPSAGDPGDDR